MSDTTKPEAVKFARGQKVIFDIPGRGQKGVTGVFDRYATDPRGVSRAIVTIGAGSIEYKAFPGSVRAVVA